MMKVFSAQVASIAVLLLIWEVAARWFIDPQFISPPSKVFVAIPKLFADPQVARAVGTSFIELASRSPSRSFSALRSRCR